MKTNMEQLKSLVEAGEKATKGEWKTDSHFQSLFAEKTEGPFRGLRLEICECSSAFIYSDVNFITQAANARQALSALLDDYERLREQNLKMRACFESHTIDGVKTKQCYDPISIIEKQAETIERLRKALGEEWPENLDMQEHLPKTLKETEICKVCKGTGSPPWAISNATTFCPHCGGSGEKK